MPNFTDIDAVGQMLQWMEQLKSELGENMLTKLSTPLLMRVRGLQRSSFERKRVYSENSVGIALGYGLDDRGLGFDSRRGLGIFLFNTASRTGLGPTQPPIEWVPGALSLGVKRPGREADHSHPSKAEAKESVELHLHSPNTPSWRGA
jgi:hypothetical protein